ncbi:MAG TPA: 2-phospho-L-lactate transferase [Actinocrinis sp.]|jgi:LPPG:FO 2-phospho-L-lactate transferase|uniref:2-phospho-L-lactate transferase n=1 Tax=Actinocrinis sp. TaxID=1920516 RepID=UPI002DDCFF04|nr:2-phospho-L-lactate transferase [Actinocrinis sp.]HEV3174132.1 2-phospho-L-lactate transferase [Actinocrinis sp.]
MRITALAGGIGGARFLRGLLAAMPDAEVTVIGNVGDDITLHGLRVCPDLDTVMYTLGDGIHEGQGWGRANETFSIAAELEAYGVGPDWFTLGDRDIATHLVRTQMLDAGYPLSAVTEALCTRWKPGVKLLPATDDRAETHVVIAEDESKRRALHFQEYWVRLHAPVAESIVFVGAEQAKPAPGVVDAITRADVVVFPPSNPVVSIGAILAVPGIREAIAATDAPVVGLSPIIGASPVRGMADKVLAAVGVETSAAAVAEYYGNELLDGWLVDESDAAAVERVQAAGIECRAVPLLMTDINATVAMARAALDLAAEVGKK